MVTSVEHELESYPAARLTTSMTIAARRTVFDYGYAGTGHKSQGSHNRRRSPPVSLS
jgi:hypothetical protein